MQFETLHALLEQALGRSISVAELSGLRSIGDVVRLVASAQQMELTEGAASDGRQVRR
jgi:acyl carrier protein